MVAESGCSGSGSSAEGTPPGGVTLALNHSSKLEHIPQVRFLEFFNLNFQTPSICTLYDQL